MSGFLFKPGQGMAQALQRFSPESRQFFMRMAAFIPFSLAFIFIAILICEQVNLSLHRRHQSPITVKLAADINTYILSFYRNAAVKIAEQDMVLAISGGTLQPQDMEALKRSLNNSRKVLYVDMVYVLDRTGAVLASSPGPAGLEQHDGASYGKYAYFTAAMAGMTGQYAGVGDVSGSKGLYFSAPVRPEAQADIQGVVVIKFPYDGLLRMLLSVRKEVRSLVLSPDGAVFAASEQQWEERTPWPLEPLYRENIAAYTYPAYLDNAPILSLPLFLSRTVGKKREVQNALDSQPLDIPGWRVLTLKTIRYPWTAVLLSCALVLALGLLLTPASVNIHQ